MSTRKIDICIVVYHVLLEQRTSSSISHHASLCFNFIVSILWVHENVNVHRAMIFWDLVMSITLLLIS